MALTINAKSYMADKFGQDVIGYTGPAHTMSVLDDVQLARVQPKPTTTLSGVGRTSAKLSRTLTLTGALTPTGLAIVQIQCSFPVGSAAADIDTALNDMGAYLASAAYKTLVKNQQISY